MPFVMQNNANDEVVYSFEKARNQVERGTYVILSVCDCADPIQSCVIRDLKCVIVERRGFFFSWCEKGEKENVAK